MKFRTSAPVARSAASTNRGSRFAARAFVTTGAAAMFVGIAGVPAFAATDPDTAVANVVVQSAISLTMTDAAFTLTGIPGATLTELGAVDFTVQTNNSLGYAVTVKAATANMVGTGTNAEVIPTSALTVRETDSGDAYTPLTSGVAAATTVHTQNTKSAEAGDTLSNDYQLVVPFVNEDTYTATLNYVATTL